MNIFSGWRWRFNIFFLYSYKNKISILCAPSWASVRRSWFCDAYHLLQQYISGIGAPRGWHASNHTSDVKS